MKKLIKVLLAVLMVACLAFTVVACNDTCKDGHDWNDGEITKAANCTEKGVKTFKCKNCDETKTEEIAIDATNHKGPEVAIDPVEPGCETAGSKDGKKCSACGATTVAPTTVPAAHNYDANTHKCTCGAVDPEYAVAQIGNVNYLTLAEAIAVGGEVKLLKDVVISEQLKVTKDLVLDLNGKTISNVVDIWNNETASYSLIAVLKGEGETGAKLTITGNGKLDAKADDCYAVAVYNGGTLVIENGEYVGNLHSIYVHTGKAEIKGGKFDLKQLDQNKIAAGGTGHEFTLNLLDANGANGTATIEVTGGTFVNYDPSHSTSEAPAANFVKGGCKVTSKTEGEDTLYSVTLGSSFETTAFGDVKKGIKYFIVGYVKEIQDGYNGKVLLQDSEGNTILVYGVFDEEGNRNEKPSDTLVVGDIVTFYGEGSEYAGTIQLAGGWLVEFNGTAKTNVAKLALTELVVPENVNADFDLPAKNGLVWTVKSGTGISVTGNKATVTRTGEDQEVVLLATLTIGEDVGTREFTVVVTAKVAGQETVTIKATELGLGSYGDSTAPVNGLEWIELMKGSGDCIQMRTKDKVSSIWNSTAYAGRILKVELVCASSQLYTKQNQLKLVFGTDASLGQNEQTITLVKGQNYVLELGADTNYTFFKLIHNNQGAVYLDSIIITYAAA